MNKVVISAQTDFSTYDLILIASNKPNLDGILSPEQLQHLLSASEVWFYGENAWTLHDELDDSIVALGQEGIANSPITNAVTDLTSFQEVIEDLLKKRGSIVVFATSDLANSF